MSARQAPALSAPGGRRDVTRLFKAAYMLFVFLAATGDWKKLVGAYGSLPKAVSLGVIALAVLSFILRPNMGRARQCLGSFAILSLLLVAIMLWTFYIWVMEFAAQESMARGTEKMIYQMFSVLVAVCSVYLWGREAIDLSFACFCGANVAIMLLETPKFGLIASIQSLLVSILTFGNNTYGFARRLELHDITFLFGQYLIYYMAFAPRETEEEIHSCRRRSAAAVFFMLAGLKRLAFPVSIVTALLARWLRKREQRGRWASIIAMLLFASFFLYLYLLKSNFVFDVVRFFGIDMKGRERFWNLAMSAFSLSPSYMGVGFEGSELLQNIWVAEGLLSSVKGLHNDIIKVFLELGFWGFCMWGGIQYVVYPRYWGRRYGKDTALLYVALLFYMSCTYATDNTAFYYWSSMGLRLIPLAYGVRSAGYGREETVSRKIGAVGGVPKVGAVPWRPPSPEDIRGSIWQLEMLEQGEDSVSSEE